jgi:hypothetical protein
MDETKRWSLAETDKNIRYQTNLKTRYMTIQKCQKKLSCEHGSCRFNKKITIEIDRKQYNRKMMLAGSLEDEPV